MRSFDVIARAAPALGAADAGTLVSAVLQKRARDLGCFYTPAQWTTPCLQWAAMNKKYATSVSLEAVRLFNLDPAGGARFVATHCLPPLSSATLSVALASAEQQSERRAVTTLEESTSRATQQRRERTPNATERRTYFATTFEESGSSGAREYRNPLCPLVAAPVDPGVAPGDAEAAAASTATITAEGDAAEDAWGSLGALRASELGRFLCAQSRLDPTRLGDWLSESGGPLSLSSSAAGPGSASSSSSSSSGPSFSDTDAASPRFRAAVARGFAEASRDGRWPCGT